MARPPLQAQIDQLVARQDAADRMREDTHKMVAAMQHEVSAMHQALMLPQVGQGDKSLLERMADVTVAAETGARAADALTKWLPRLAYIGGLIAAAIVVLAKLEFWKE